MDLLDSLAEQVLQAACERTAAGPAMKRRIQAALESHNGGPDPAVLARAEAALRVAAYDETNLDTIGDMMTTVRHAIAALRAGGAR